MPDWTPWNAEDDALDELTVIEIVQKTEALSDADLLKLLQDKIASDLSPPTIEQAAIKFRQMSGPDVTIREALRRTRLFCRRFSK